MEISKVVAAVLGIANSGPIAKNKIVVRIKVNLVPILFVMLSNVPLPLEQANIANSGSPTPVRINPMIPRKYWSPNLFPRDGGKIKLPAPKNMENRANPTIIGSLILFFGAGNNFILAFILLFFVGIIGGSPVMDPVISNVTEGYPMSDAGIEAGDTILEINGHETKTIDDVQLFITLNEAGSDMDLKIKDSEGAIKSYTITPKLVEKDGVEGYYYGMEFETTYESGFFNAIKYSFVKMGAIVRQMVYVLKSLFTGGISVNNLSGPVGIYSVVGEAKSYGFLTLMQLTALLSVNVGFLNLIPFPAFDGGRIFLLLVEKIKGKPIKSETENSNAIRSPHPCR